MSANLGWDILVEISILFSFLLLGSYLRAKIKFLQNYLIPVALIGGFLAMLMNESFMGKIAPILALPFDMDRLGVYVFHLLTITVVAMAWREPEGKKRGKDALAMGFGASTLYALQGVVGIGLGFVLMYTIYPDLFPTFGALAPLGFGQGPGLTYSIAQSWETTKYFEHAGNLGLTFAAFGYFWACFIGVPIVNYGIKKGWATLVKDKSQISRDTYTGIFSKKSERPIAGKLTTASEALESFTFHVALIGLMMLITFVFMFFVVQLLINMGAGGFAKTMEGFFFIFAMLFTLLMRRIVHKVGLGHLIDNGIMSRIAGLSVDFLVVCAIAAISLAVVIEFIVPILITGVSVGLVTLFFIFWYAKRSFKEYQFERAIAVYGMLTGTINTGLILLRMLDPEYKTPVAQDLVYTSAIALPLCFPLLLMINWPLKGVEVVGEGWIHADPSAYWQTLLGVFIMYVILMIVYRVTGLIKFKRPLSKIWLDD